MGGQLWEVVGGASAGGILVRTGKDTSSPAEAARLSTGALVEQLQLDGERLEFKRLSGSGPARGWVSLKLKDKDLLVKSDKEPPIECWEVVGGASSGGIMVRTGKDNSTPEAASRLSTGALVRELELDGVRLQYELLEGKGPETGWVSVKTEKRALLVKTDKRPAVDHVGTFINLMRHHEDASYAKHIGMLPSLKDSEERPALVEKIRENLQEREDRFAMRIRRKALRSLAGLGEWAAVAEMLEDKDCEMRCDAALNLGSPIYWATLPLATESRPGAAEVAKLAEVLAKDTEWRVRLHAAVSLGKLGAAAADAVPALKAAQEDADADVKAAAAHSLKEIDAGKVLPREFPAAGSRPPYSEPPSGRKARVLCIHGAPANSKIMKMQAAGFKAALGKEFDWVFVDSSQTWEPVIGSHDPLYAEPDDMLKMVAGKDPFRWWYSHGNTVYYFVEEGIADFCRLLEEHAPIDVVVSFSQGSNLQSLVLEHFRHSGKTPPWQVSVMFSGGQIDDPIYMFQANCKSAHPVVRSFGNVSDDFFAHGEPSLDFMYTNAIEFGHADGHGFPRTQPRAKEIFEGMAKQVKKLCGFSP
mmetsp:Transcript_137148/g.242441  ORF Transcript_137148/g.242441 Transcript_137148/m.242441 type:complete len:586 (-) Transcript_137148:50-1807(-)